MEYPSGVRKAAGASSIMLAPNRSNKEPRNIDRVFLARDPHTPQNMKPRGERRHIDFPFSIHNPEHFSSDRLGNRKSPTIRPASPEEYRRVIRDAAVWSVTYTIAMNGTVAPLEKSHPGLGVRPWSRMCRSLTSEMRLALTASQKPRNVAPCHHH